jgi:hypothetical protein
MAAVKKLIFLCALLFVSIIRAEQTLPVDLVSLSVQIFPASTRDPFTGLDYELSISAVPNANNINNELALAGSDVPYTHQGYFVLLDPTTFEPTVFPFVLDVPDFSDLNENGVADFFDPAASVESIRTEGRHPTADGGGADFSATWSREAGSVSGTVVLDFPYFGLEFTHPFELLSYQGNFSYAEINNSAINGTVSLTNITTEAEFLHGPLVLNIASTDVLQYDAGTWNATDDLTYNFSPIDTLDLSGLDYVALIEFVDGFPGTSGADYLDWVLVLHSADLNTNRIPDLVESNPDSAAPTLEIVKTAEGIQLVARGQAGEYALEAAGEITGVWNSLQSVQIGNAPATATLPRSHARKFFRLRRDP